VVQGSGTSVHWDSWIDVFQFNKGGTFSGEKKTERFRFRVLNQRFQVALEEDVVKIKVECFGLRVEGFRRTGILGLTVSSIAGERGGLASGTCVGV